MNKQSDYKKGKKVIDSKKISKRLLALLSALSILLTSCGNENKKDNNVSENKIKSSKINLLNEVKYGDVLNVIADESKIDELLTDNVNFHIMDYVNEYEKARKEKDVEKLKLLISKIGLTTIKAKAFDVIPLNVEQIEKMSLTNIDNQITLFVYLNPNPISYDFGTINFYGLGDKLVYTLSGDRLNMVLNGIIRSQSETLNLEEIDLLYKTILELMIEEVILSENSNITFTKNESNSLTLNLFKSEEKSYNNSLKYIKK